MSAPRWAPVDDETADLLALVADTERVVGADVPALFLAACEADAQAHDGLVSVNRVRARLADADIPPRRYSSLWSRFTGTDKPMRKMTPADGAQVWEICEGSRSGNDGRPFPLRRWVG